MNTFLILTFAVLCVVCVLGTPQDELETRITELGNVLGQNGSSILNKDQAEAALKEKCEKNGDDGTAFEKLKNAKENIQSCLQPKFNETLLRSELEEAQKTGSMDVVFKKYCEEYPETYSCVEPYIDTAEKCMSDKEKEAFNRTLQLVKNLKEFACFKDGDRLALFFAENGEECLNSQKENLQLCLNQTLGTQVPEEFSLTTLPDLAIGEEECSKLDSLKVCVVKELEKCSNPTPSNLVSTFIDFIRKNMPCSEKYKAKNGSSSHTLLSTLILMFVTLLCKYF